MRPDTLGIVGLGALGGSLAWQATLAGVPRVIGYSQRPADGVAAVRAGAIRDLAPSLPFLLDRADLVVFAGTPADAVRGVADCAGRPTARCLCTDLIPAKLAIVRVAEALGLRDRFAGSHPVVALHGETFADAEPAAFRSAIVYVTPVGGDDRPAREIAHFWASVCEAEPVIVDADDHDAIVAWTRHLPEVVAAAVARACVTDGPRGVTFGSAARDLARAVPAHPGALKDVLLLHREPVLRVLDDFEDGLGTLRRALRECDGPAVEAWLAAAAQGGRRLGA